MKYSERRIRPVNPKTLENPTSVGLAYGNQEFKIVDGELWIKGDNILTEYYNSPERADEYLNTIIKNLPFYKQLSIVSPVQMKSFAKLGLC